MVLWYPIKSQWSKTIIMLKDFNPFIDKEVVLRVKQSCNENLLNWNGEITNQIQ